jgi:hypothetical protein
MEFLSIKGVILLPFFRAIYFLYPKKTKITAMAAPETGGIYCHCPENLSGKASLSENSS